MDICHSPSKTSCNKLLQWFWRWISAFHPLLDTLYFKTFCNSNDFKMDICSSLPKTHYNQLFYWYWGWLYLALKLIIIKWYKDFRNILSSPSALKLLATNCFNEIADEYLIFDLAFVNENYSDFLFQLILMTLLYHRRHEDIYFSPSKPPDSQLLLSMSALKLFATDGLCWILTIVFLKPRLGLYIYDALLF